MLSALECSLKAEDLEEIALACAGKLAADYHQLAADWRYLARQAAWQEELDKEDGTFRH